MTKLPTTRIELLKNLMDDLEVYQEKYNKEFNLCIENEENLKYLREEVTSKVIRFARQLDLTNWNFNCFSKNNYNFDEDFDIIADEIRNQYVYECEKNQITKFKILLDIAINEAKKENNSEVIKELNEITPMDIIDDNGNRFKNSIKKLITPVGSGLMAVSENVIKAGTEGVATAFLNHIK